MITKNFSEELSKTIKSYTARETEEPDQKVEGLDQEAERIPAGEKKTTKPKTGRPKSSNSKSKHVHLLVRPDTWERVSELAKEDGRSVNDYVNRLIQEAIDDKS